MYMPTFGKAEQLNMAPRTMRRQLSVVLKRLDATSVCLSAAEKRRPWNDAVRTQGSKLLHYSFKVLFRHHHARYDTEMMTSASGHAPEHIVCSLLQCMSMDNA